GRLAARLKDPIVCDRTRSSLQAAKSPWRLFLFAVLRPDGKVSIHSDRLFFLICPPPPPPPPPQRRLRSLTVTISLRRSQRSIGRGSTPAASTPRPLIQRASAANASPTRSSCRRRTSPRSCTWGTG